jgi:hypothetical protein
MVNATLQAAALSALSNVLAQGLQAYQKNVSQLHQETTQQVLIE